MMYRWNIARRRTGKNTCELVLVYWLSSNSDKSLLLEEVLILDFIMEEKLHDLDRVFGIPFEKSNAYTPVNIFGRVKDYLYRLITAKQYNFNEW